MSGYSTYERIIVSLVSLVVLFLVYSVVHALQKIPFDLEASVEINATPEQIWPFIEDLLRRPVWQWRIVHVNTLTPTKMEVGSRQWVFYSYYENNWEGEEVVTHYEVNILWAARRTSPRTNAHVAIGLKKVGEVGRSRTKVTYMEKVLEKDFNKRINFIFEGKKANTLTQNSLLKLKELVEKDVAAKLGVK